MQFEIVGTIEQVETISTGTSVRIRAYLRKAYGPDRWRKRRGIATVRLPNGKLRRVELHWYEAHGIGKRDFKIKLYLDMLNVHQLVISSLVGMLSLVVLSSAALGQSGVPAPRWADRQSAPAVLVWPPLAEVQRRSLMADELMGRSQPAPRGASRDTLENGAIIGAVVGAVAVGSFGAFFCNLYEGDSCLLDTLRVAAVGAAIGAGTGLAIDAALTRHAGVAVRIGIRF